MSVKCELPPPRTHIYALTDSRRWSVSMIQKMKTESQPCLALQRAVYLCCPPLLHRTQMRKEEGCPRAKCSPVHRAQMGGGDYFALYVGPNFNLSWMEIPFLNMFLKLLNLLRKWERRNFDQLSWIQQLQEIKSFHIFTFMPQLRFFTEPVMDGGREKTITGQTLGRGPVLLL